VKIKWRSSRSILLHAKKHYYEKEEGMQVIFITIWEFIPKQNQQSHHLVGQKSPVLGETLREDDN
jgi:hypothetical protein